MAFLWGLQLLSLIFIFSEPERINSSETDDTKKVRGGEGFDEKSKSYGSVVNDADQCNSSSSKKNSVWNDVVSVCKIIFSNPTVLVSYFWKGVISIDFATF